MKRPRTEVSRKTSAAAAEILGSIDDLLIQVFLHIPLKQVFRLKLVSKHWNSIISDPKLHLSLRKPEPAVGLIFNLHSLYESYILYFDQPTIPKPNGHDCAQVVLHSCNGLLLCKSVLGCRRHYIYNPITKKTSTLDPGTGPWKLTHPICGMYLAFDPSKSCHYKFVCVVELGERRRLQRNPRDRVKFEVYSSETGCWRNCGEPFSATVNFESGGVYWKGALHWVSLKKSGKSIYFNPCGDDNDRMLPTVMPTPPLLGDAKDRKFFLQNCHFGESCGHLNFIDASRRVFDELNVYEMKSDYSEWFVKYKVDLSNVFVNDFLCVCALVRGKKEDNDDSFLVFRVGNKFMRCNLVDNTCETIYECEGKSKLEKELLDHDGQFPLQYIEGAYGNLDGVWYTEQEMRSPENHLDGVWF